MHSRSLRYEDLLRRVTYGPESRERETQSLVGIAFERRIITPYQSRTLFRILSLRKEIRDTVLSFLMRNRRSDMREAFLESLKQGYDPTLVVTEARHAHSSRRLGQKDLDRIEGDAIVASVLQRGESLPLDDH